MGCFENGNEISGFKNEGNFMTRLWAVRFLRGNLRNWIMYMKCTFINSATEDKFYCFCNQQERYCCIN